MKKILGIPKEMLDFRYPPAVAICKIKEDLCSFSLGESGTYFLPKNTVVWTNYIEGDLQTRYGGSKRITIYFFNDKRVEHISIDKDKVKIVKELPLLKEENSE